MNAFYKAATNKISGQIFNLGSGKPKSVNELVKILGGKKFISQKDQESQILLMQILENQKNIKMVAKNKL